MSVCVQSIVKRRLGGVFGGAILLVVGSISAGIALGEYLTDQAEPKKSAAVTKTAVLQDSDWLSESYWKRRKQKKLRQRANQRANKFSGRSNLGVNPFDQNVGQQPRARKRVRRDSGNYRTVCVRLCDGYYFPISFSTTRDRFAQDEQACQSKCSGDSRLYYYKNSSGSPETMVDRRGRAYAELGTAFLYRTTYSKSCQCKPDPWSDAAKQQHAMYATEEWQRKARRLARKERKRAKYARRTRRGSQGRHRVVAAPEALAVPAAAALAANYTPSPVVSYQVAPKRYSQVRIRKAPKVVRRKRVRPARSRARPKWKSFITDH